MSKVRHLIFGHGISEGKSRGALKNQVYTFLIIWRNYHHHDFGVERLIRLVLALAQFLTPGLYLKEIFRGFSSTTRKLVIECYVIFKMIFPILAMKAGWAANTYVLWLIVFFLCETIIYITSLIFISDASRESVQPRRSLVLLLVNFFEIVFDFSFIYAHYDLIIDNFFTRPLHGTTDAIYFSFVTAATVGFGDIAPLHVLAEKLTIIQLTLTFVFVGLFLNYFASLLQTHARVNVASKFRKVRHNPRKNS